MRKGSWIARLAECSSQHWARSQSPLEEENIKWAVLPSIGVQDLKEEEEEQCPATGYSFQWRSRICSVQDSITSWPVSRVSHLTREEIPHTGSLWKYWVPEEETKYRMPQSPSRRWNCGGHHRAWSSRQLFLSLTVWAPSNRCMNLTLFFHPVKQQKNQWTWNLVWLEHSRNPEKRWVTSQGRQMFQLKATGSVWETIIIHHRGEQKAYGRDRGDESLDTPWTSHLQTF